MGRPVVPVPSPSSGEVIHHIRRVSARPPRRTHFRTDRRTAKAPPCRPMSSPTVTQPNPLSDGLSSLVLSKRYLAGARPPHMYKLDRGTGSANDAGVYDNDSAVVAAAGCWPSTAGAVQARYEPSDVFTPLVFEEIRQPSSPPPSHITNVWLRPDERIPLLVQPQPQPPHFAATPQPPHVPQFSHRTHVSGNQRRPLQHLPPPAQSTLPKPSSDDHRHRPNTNRPGDLSWLVNFQVASIFETTPTCNGTVAAAAACGGSAANNNIFDGEWQEPETLKQKKKNAKTDQKSSSKISRKPYRMPPSRLDKANKPGYTYTEMIHQALMEKKELPVAEIYQWISSHFPYFREDDERWKNSVRHNLSINPNFRKGRKSQGAGHYWRLCNTEESLGQREYSTIVEDDVSSSPQEPSELEEACKYLESELRRENRLEDVKIHQSIDTELENEMYTNSFLISSPSKFINEQISISNNNDFDSYSDNLLEESIDFQYYNL